jgi:hypothetical protein
MRHFVTLHSGSSLHDIHVFDADLHKTLKENVQVSKEPRHMWHFVTQTPTVWPPTDCFCLNSCSWKPKSKSADRICEWICTVATHAHIHTHTHTHVHTYTSLAAQHVPKNAATAKVRPVIENVNLAVVEPTNACRSDSTAYQVWRPRDQIQMSRSVVKLILSESKKNIRYFRLVSVCKVRG